MVDGATLIDDVTAEVEVQPDGTLSRVLFRDDHLRLVAFSFDQGQELTDHTAGVPVVLQVVSGSFEVTMDGETAVVGPHAWLHMRAGLPHAVKALEASVMTLMLLKSGS